MQRLGWAWEPVWESVALGFGEQKLSFSVGIANRNQFSVEKSAEGGLRLLLPGWFRHCDLISFLCCTLGVCFKPRALLALSWWEGVP